MPDTQDKIKKLAYIEDNIDDILESFKLIPTRKRDRIKLRDDHIRWLRQSTIEIIEHVIETGIDIASSTIQFLAKVPAKTKNARYLRAWRLTKFLAFSGAITHDEYRFILEHFKQDTNTRWIDKAIPPEHLALITDAAIAKMLKSPHVYTNILLSAYIAIAQITGARSSSIITLQRKDIVIIDDKCILNMLIAKKSNEDYRSAKIVPLNTRLINGMKFALPLEALLYSTRHKPDDVPIFHNRYNKPYDSTTWSTLFRSFTKRITGIPYKPHSIRHFVGKLITEQYGVYNASLALDHESLSSTQHYLPATQAFDYSGVQLPQISLPSTTTEDDNPNNKRLAAAIALAKAQSV